MALQLGALGDALIDAGAKPELAEKAAEELAGYENRFDRLDREMERRFNGVDLRFEAVEREMGRRFNGVDLRFETVERELDRRFAAMDRRNDELGADARLLRWMVGFVLAFQVAMFIKLFVH